jgi:hypothetical protein
MVARIAFTLQDATPLLLNVSDRWDAVARGRSAGLIDG